MRGRCVLKARLLLMRDVAILSGCCCCCCFVLPLCEKGC